MPLPIVAILALAAMLAGLQVLRWSDTRRARAAWRSLEQTAWQGTPRFHPGLVDGLPEPARRFFLFAIAPGTPLSPVVEIDMCGQLSLGARTDSNAMPMRARQLLAGERGFVWLLRAGSGAMRIAGSDGYADGLGWTRFWLLGLVPVARVSGRDDVARSAAGRAIAESAFWAPATLLPRPEVAWEAVDADTARVRVTHGAHEHLLDITVSEDGRLRSVLLQRWSRENPERTWRLQPFGGTVEGIVEVGGYRVAAAVEGGNWFGTPDYFPFYRARVTRVRLLPDR